MSQPQYFLGEAKRDDGCQAAPYQRKAEASDSLYPTCNRRVKYSRETAMRASDYRHGRLLCEASLFYLKGKRENFSARSKNQYTMGARVWYNVNTKSFWEETFNAIFTRS
jgi:hypothetical protein